MPAETWCTTKTTLPASILHTRPSPASYSQRCQGRESRRGSDMPRKTSPRCFEMLLIDDSLTDAQLAIRAITRYRPDISIHYFANSEDAIEYLKTLDSNLSLDHTPAPLCFVLCDLKM